MRFFTLSTAYAALQLLHSLASPVSLDAKDGLDNSTHLEKRAETNPLFGASGVPRVYDVIQGNRPNSATVAALRMVTLKDPTSVGAMITDDNNRRTCSVTFPVDPWVAVGVSQTISTSSYNYRTVINDDRWVEIEPHDGPIWPAVLLEALRRERGIACSPMNRALEVLTGEPTTLYWLYELSDEGLTNILTHSAHTPILVQTPKATDFSPGDRRLQYYAQEDQHLMLDHAYGVVGFNGNSVSLMNPKLPQGFDVKTYSLADFHAFFIGVTHPSPAPDTADPFVATPTGAAHTLGAKPQSTKAATQKPKAGKAPSRKLKLPSKVALVKSPARGALANANAAAKASSKQSTSA